MCTLRVPGMSTRVRVPVPLVVRGGMLERYCSRCRRPCWGRPKGCGQPADLALNPKPSTLLNAAAGPGLPQNSASQKAAALTAIAALSKRLTGGASIAAFTDNRGHSPPRCCMDHGANLAVTLPGPHHQLLQAHPNGLCVCTLLIDMDVGLVHLPAVAVTASSSSSACSRHGRDLGLICRDCMERLCPCAASG